MKIGSAGNDYAMLAAQAMRQTAQLKFNAGEARETAAQEAAESRQTQIAEGEVGRNVNTYA